MKIFSLGIPKIFILSEKIDFVIFLEKFASDQTLYIITPAVQNAIYFNPTKGSISGDLDFVKKELDNKIKNLNNISKIVAVGASKIIDQAKYISFKLNVPLIVIPSILSTNAFSTDKAVLGVEGKSTSVDVRAPDEVYIVYSLLDMVSPRYYNRFGLIDVLSIYTAVKDWDIAIAEKQAIVAVEYFFAKAILEAFLNVSSELETNYYNITKLLLQSGLVVGMYGDGRPESGSEHIIAKAIESKISCFHAHSVSFGILTVMKLQNSWEENIALLARDIPDWKSDYGRNILGQIEKNLLYIDIKSRPNRYTVLDKTDKARIDIAMKDTIKFLKQ